MRPRRVQHAFDDPGYTFELKHDGFRAVLYVENGQCWLVSRNQKNLKFESLKKALSGLPVKGAVLDGEVICLDSKGVSRFNALLERKVEPIFYTFDLLWLDGEDLRKLPLIGKRPSLTVRNWVGEAEGHGGADIRVPLHHRVGVEGPIDNRCSIGSGPFQHVFHFVIE